MIDQDEHLWLKQQVVELQSQLAFQEDTLQALNDIITRQQQQIERLNELCVHNQSRLDSLVDQPQFQADKQPLPPHY